MLGLDRDPHGLETRRMMTSRPYLSEHGIMADVLLVVAARRAAATAACWWQRARTSGRTCTPRFWRRSASWTCSASTSSQLVRCRASRCLPLAAAQHALNTCKSCYLANAVPSLSYRPSASRQRRDRADDGAPPAAAPLRAAGTSACNSRSAARLVVRSSDHERG